MIAGVELSCCMVSDDAMARHIRNFSEEYITTVASERILTVILLFNGIKIKYHEAILTWLAMLLYIPS